MGQAMVDAVTTEEQAFLGDERQPQGNHLLCLGVVDNPAAHAPDSQRLIDAVQAQGGVAFLAHPIERNSTIIRLLLPLPVRPNMPR